MRRFLRFVLWGLIGVVALVGALGVLFVYFVYTPAPEVPRLSGTLSKGTIEKVMAKSDIELGLEVLLNPEKFRGR